MKKVQTVLSILAIALASASFYYSKSSSQLVYVDVNKLIEGYKKTKVIRSEFEKKSSTMKAGVDTLMTNWQNELKSYEKERVSLSPKELKLKQELLAGKQQQINAYQQAIQKQMQEENQKVNQSVINDINEYVKDYGKKHSYKIIFGAGGNGNIMYAEESTDLTEDVLNGLNSEYEKK